MRATTAISVYPDKCFHCCWYLDGRFLLWKQPGAEREIMIHLFCKENDWWHRKKTPNNKFTYFGWFEWIICWEVNCEEKYSPLIWTVILWKQKQKWANWQFCTFLCFTCSMTFEWYSTYRAHYCCLPMKYWGRKKQKILTVNNFRKIIIDSSVSNNCKSVIFTHSPPQLVQQSIALVDPSAGLTVPITKINILKRAFI